MKNQGWAKGMNLPSILEETRVFDKFLGILIVLRGNIDNLRAKSKVELW